MLDRHHNFYWPFPQRRDFELACHYSCCCKCLLDCLAIKDKTIFNVLVAQSPGLPVAKVNARGAQACRLDDSRRNGCSWINCPQTADNHGFGKCEVIGIVNIEAVNLAHPESDSSWRSEGARVLHGLNANEI